VFGECFAVAAFEELPIHISIHTGIFTIAELSEGYNCVMFG